MYPSDMIKILHKLEQTYWVIKQEISGLSEEQLRTKTDLNERTIFGIIYHFDYYEQTYLSLYIRSFMYRKDLVFTSFVDEESWNCWFRGSTLEQLASFHYERKRNIDLLKNCGEEVWERAGVHEKRGKIKLLYPVSTTVDHDDYHIEHIRTIKKYLMTDR